MKRLLLTCFLLTSSLLLTAASSQACNKTLWLHASNDEAHGGRKQDEVSLHFGRFPGAGKPSDKQGKLWLISPGESVEELTFTEGKNSLDARIKPTFAGQYTAYSFYKDKKEKRHYAKTQFFRFGREVKGKKADKLPLEIPLEIVPVTRLNMHRRLYENDTFIFKVNYQNKPLSNVPLTVITQQGWSKTFCPDNEGKIKVNFIKDKPAKAAKKMCSELYLFQAQIKEPATNEIICATYTLDVYPSPREWQSKSLGYITALVTIALIAAGFVYIRGKRP